jgi:hypothetical protein
MRKMIGYTVMCTMAACGVVGAGGSPVEAASATTKRAAVRTLFAREPRPPAQPAARKERAASRETPQWQLTGSRIIACCCASPCPCRINKPPMHCHGCDFTTAVRIDKGYLGKTRMDGVQFVIIGRVFGEKPAENWTYVYVSDRTTDEQFQALRGMLQEGSKALGDKVGYIAGRPLGIRKVPIRYTISADGRDHNTSIAEILELKTRSMILPGRTQPVKSTGIFDDYGDGFTHAECLEHRYRDPQINRAWDLSGRQANQAGFTLTPERVARGDIGWGCWSAHADLGSRDRYQEQLIGHDQNAGSCCEKK